MYIYDVQLKDNNIEYIKTNDFLLYLFRFLILKKTKKAIDSTPPPEQLTVSLGFPNPGADTWGVK